MEPVHEPLSYASRVDSDELLREIQAAMDSGNLSRAAKLARRALEARIEHPGFYVLVGQEALNEGRPEEALGLFQRGRKLDARDPNLLTGLGLAMAAASRHAEALEAFDAALKYAPGFAGALALKGEAHEHLGQLDQAVAAYEAAYQAGHQDPAMTGRRAWLAADQGDSAAAREWAGRALGKDAAQPLGRLALAKAQLLDGELDQVRATMEAVDVGPWGPANRAHAMGVLGDMFDAQGDYVTAFQHYASANRELARLYPEEYALRREHNPAEFLERLTARFDRAERSAWTAPEVKPAERGPKAHVFLVGFPRSGTTLLEQILAARPDAASLEEQPSLSDAEEAFFSSLEGMERLEHIGPDEAARLRELYWRRVRGFGVEPEGRLFVDKMPMNTVLLPAIAKLFPEAKVLFARRDPRDVVLSCYRQRFGTNPAMYPFLTIGGTMEHYVSIMRLAQAYMDALPLDLTVVRHEALVADLEAETRRICDFLGVEWDPAMAEFAERRARAVNTPSAAQLARGLTDRGVGQWKNYREQLAPVLPRLEPWVEQFGYAPTEEA
jgi:tetratricopeptide (TPR) repeat protein